MMTHQEMFTEFQSEMEASDLADRPSGDVYTFPCGCSFPIDPSIPPFHGHPSIIYEVEKVRLDCPAVWELLASGRTKGVFQLESNLGKHWSKRLKPEHIEHLAALTAILRPGVLNSRDERGISTTELYCRRKNGEEEANIDIDAVKDILGTTYGVMIYQEQMMAISQKVSNFNLVEVDKLRKAAGKKSQEEMTKVGELFIKKAEEFGVITKQQAIDLFDNIRKSGKYLFNKAHSVSYAWDCYWSAHQKAHFPLYFFTSYLYFAKEKQKPLDEIRALINDAKLFNISVQPPRFSDLEKNFSTNGVEITFGLSDVKGIGEKMVDKMVAGIEGAEGRIGRPRVTWTWFEFLVYFSEHLSSTMIKKMIEVGALRNFRLDRLRLLAEYDAWSRLTERERELVAGLRDPVVAMVPEEKLEKYMANIPEGAATVDYDHYDDEAHTVPVVLDPERPVESLEAALKALLARVVGFTKGTKKTPGKPSYALSKAGKEKVASLLTVLRDPPAPLEDKPYWIAKKEEEALGVPITFTHVDAVDKTRVNTTCKELRGGKDKGKMVIGVEVQEMREIAIKNGKNVGKTMAFLSVADETGALDDVVVFSDAWERYGNMLSREKTVVGLEGYRDQNKGGFVVERVWEI